MTKVIQEPQRPSEIFSKAFETLTVELELAVKWNRAFTILIIHNSTASRPDLVFALEQFLCGINQNVVRCQLDADSLNRAIHVDKAEAGKVFFLEGAQKTNVPSPAIPEIFANCEDVSAARKANLVFWLTDREARQLVRRYPEIWTSRQCLIDLEDTRDSEQMLNDSLEAEWSDFSDKTYKLNGEGLESESMTAGAISPKGNLLLALGILHWRKQEFEKAEASIRQAIELTPVVDGNWFKAECLNALALIKSSMGRFEEAIAAYKDAILLAPRQMLAWNNLGNMCLKAGRNDQAMIAYQKAIEHNPQDPIAWNGLGNVFCKAQYFEEALKAYRKAIELSPSLPHPWNGLGDVLESTGQAEKAIQAFQMSAKLDGQRADPWLKLARLFAKNHKSNEAVKAFQQVLKLEPNNCALWNELGTLHLESKSYNGAIASLKKAIEVDSEFGEAYLNLGIAQAGAELHKEAIPALQRAIELLTDPSEKSNAWSRLAESYRRLNEYDKALAAYQEADKLNFADRGHTESGAITQRSTKEKSVAFAQVDIQEHEPADQPQWAADASEPEVDEPIRNLESGSLVHDKSSINEEVHPSAVSATPPATNGNLGMNLDLTSLSKKFAVANPIKNQGKELGFPRSASALQDRAGSTEWNEKGNALFLAGKYQEAITAYKHALELDASSGRPYANLALAYSLFGNYADAVQLYSAAIILLSSEQEKAVCWNEIGNIHRCLSRYEQAVLAYQKADELDPKGLEALANTERSVPNVIEEVADSGEELGDFYFFFENHDKSEEVLRKAVELDSSSASSLNELALTMAFQKKYGEAIPLFQKSIDLFKDDKQKAETWNRLGDVYRRLNNYDSARDAYQNAMNLNQGQSSLMTRTRLSLLGNCFVD